MIIEGSISVKAAIKGKKRLVNLVYIDSKKRDKDTNYIRFLCRDNNILVKELKRDELNKMALGKTHGGILADVLKRKNDSLDSLITNNSFIALIQGVEDPFNLGYSFRSLYSAGCSGVIIDDREFNESEAVIIKSSSGASEFLNIYKSDDMIRDIKYIKSKNIKCVAALRKDAVSYLEYDFKNPVLIAIGGEKRGLNKNVIEVMDKNIYIPYENDFRNALNASSATAVFAYEVLRQRSL